MSADSPAAPASSSSSKAKGAVSKKASDQAASPAIPTTPGWYVVGLRSSGGQPPPRHAVTFGGISFPEYAYDENPTIKDDSIEYNQRRRGQRIWLDEEDLEAIREACGKRIVRVRSEKAGRYAILRAGEKAARRSLRGDKPLEAFLYITPAEAPEEAAEAAEASLPDAIV